MRAVIKIGILFTAILGASPACAQSAFLESGQSSTGFGMTLQRGDHSTTIGLGAILSTERRNDVNLALYTSSGANSTAYGGVVGYTYYGAPKHSAILPGFQIAVECYDPPGRPGPGLIGSAGIDINVPARTGKSSRFVFSIGGRIGYLITADKIPRDRTVETIWAGIGQSIPIDPKNFMLLSVGVSTDVSFEAGFIGFELAFLLPD